jgi:SnoaL-like domain
VTPGNSKPDNEAQVRAVIDGWAKAIGAKDIDAVMSHYAADIVTFDLAPPLQTTGPEALKKSLEAWFPTFRPSRLRDPRPLHHDGHRRRLLPQSESDQRGKDGRRGNKRLGARDRRLAGDRRQMVDRSCA